MSRWLKLSGNCSGTKGRSSKDPTLFVCWPDMYVWPDFKMCLYFFRVSTPASLCGFVDPPHPPDTEEAVALLCVDPAER